MTERSVGPNEKEELRGKIRAAFPDVVFAGRITPVDGDTHEDFDEEWALYGALHGKKWSEVPQSFIKSYADTIPLLTEEAFEAFFAAWLSAALDIHEVRKVLVYPLSNDRLEGDTSYMDARLRRLSESQKEATLAILASALDRESSEHFRSRARIAIEYVGSVR
jgi:hypothetical protein